MTRDGTDVLGNMPAYYDAALTQAWMRTLQAADARLMATLAGVYYTEIPAPQLGMISCQYRSYSANGLFEYRDETCSATGCSTSQGHRRWGGLRPRRQPALPDDHLVRPHPDECLCRRRTALRR